MEIEASLEVLGIGTYILVLCCGCTLLHSILYAPYIRWDLLLVVICLGYIKLMYEGTCSTKLIIHNIQQWITNYILSLRVLSYRLSNINNSIWLIDMLKVTRKCDFVKLDLKLKSTTLVNNILNLRKLDDFKILGLRILLSYSTLSIKLWQFI